MTTPIPHRPLRLAATLLTLGALPAAAQTIVHELVPAGPFGSIGDQVASAGDVDGDGVDDLLVAGRVGIVTFSGAGGVELSFHDVETFADGFAPLNILGLPDVDADGAPDLLVASRDQVRAYSRTSGALLWTFDTPDDGGVGYRLALTADLDADGVDDLVVSEQYASPNGVNRAGSIHVLASTTGATLNRIDGTATFQEIGERVTVLGDLTNDGVDELAYDDEDFLVGGQTFGRVVIVSADDGRVVRTIVSPVQTFNFPFDLAPAGDVDGDGMPDLAMTWFVNSTGATHQSVRSGATGNELWDVTGNSLTNLTNVGDIDGDGIDDLATSTPGSFLVGASARISNGATGATLLTIGGGAGDFRDLAAVGDLDGDGVPDLLAGAIPSGIVPTPPFAATRSLADGGVLHVFTNPPGGEGLGRALARGGDRDGDGIGDWILLGTSTTAHFSGATGELLLTLALPPATISIFKAPTAVAGSVDDTGDGIPEHIVGDSTFSDLILPLAGRIVRVSGSDGSVLAQRTGPTSEQLGHRMDTGHDADSDGIPDVWTSAITRSVAGHPGAGQVELVSGATLAPIMILDGLVQNDGHFGSSVSSGADLDLDGIPDVAVGSDEESVGQFDSGRLAVFSGADGSPILSVDGALGSVTTLGALVGDADADGIPDVLVNEPFFDLPGESTQRGRVRLVSGATGAVLWTSIGATGNEQFGLRAAGAGDVDGDGLADVLVCSIPSGVGSFVSVLSGADGSLLDAFDADPDSTVNAAVALGSAGLVDAGGCAEFVVGVITLENNGGAHVYASSQGGNWGFVDLGHGLAGSDAVPPYLGITGDLQGGGAKTLAALRALPNKVAAWFLSVGEANVPFKGGILVPSPFVGWFVGIATTDANGEIVFGAPTPFGIPQGVSLWHQFAFQDPLAPVGVSLSNGLREIFKGD